MKDEIRKEGEETKAIYRTRVFHRADLQLGGLLGEATALFFDDTPQPLPNPSQGQSTGTEMLARACAAQKRYQLSEDQAIDVYLSRFEDTESGRISSHLAAKCMYMHTYPITHTFSHSHNVACVHAGMLTYFHATYFFANKTDGITTKCVRDVWKHTTWGAATKPFWELGTAGNSTRAEVLARAVAANREYQLNEDQAIDIYLARLSDPDSNHLSWHLASKYGVTTKAIRDVWRHATWSAATKPFWPSSAGGAARSSTHESGFMSDGASASRGGDVKLGTVFDALPSGVHAGGLGRGGDGGASFPTSNTTLASNPSTYTTDIFHNQQNLNYYISQQHSSDSLHSLNQHPHYNVNQHPTTSAQPQTATFVLAQQGDPRHARP